ncbi:MAG: hypothetical protein ACLP50_09815 [Solirubrobacteraceae bacterium]
MRLRSAELRGLRAQDLRRPRSNARHYRLFVRGKGGREREVPDPGAVQQALEAWVKVHPLARGVALLDEQPLFVRLGRLGHVDLRPTARYAASRPERTDEIADVLDRRRQAARRIGGAP